MGRRGQPCTKHRYREDYCTRCGQKQRHPRVLTPRRKEPDVDVVGLARHFLHCINEVLNPPKAAVPKDPSRRTPFWERQARSWENHQWALAEKACWGTYWDITHASREPCYSRRCMRQARRLLAAISPAMSPEHSMVWSWADVKLALEPALAKELSRAWKGRPEKGTDPCASNLHPETGRRD